MAGGLTHEVGGGLGLLLLLLAVIQQLLRYKPSSIEGRPGGGGGGKSHGGLGLAGDVDGGLRLEVGVLARGFSDSLVSLSFSFSFLNLKFQDFSFD